MTHNAFQSDAERAHLFELLLVELPTATTCERVDSLSASILAQALAYGVPDPNALVGSPCRPILSWVMSGLYQKKNITNFEDNYIEVSVDPTVSLPRAFGTLCAAERFAIWLLQQGADPWLKDDSGKDTFDWALMNQSRTLVDAILSHPNTPSIQDLQQRTTSWVGRELPWLHTVVYHNAFAMFQHLVEKGFDPQQLDRNGFSVHAWVNNAVIFNQVAKATNFSPDADAVVKLGAMWSRRHSQKLVRPLFNLEQLKSELSQFTSLSEENVDQLKLFGLMEDWWAANPLTKTYSYKGYSWQSYNTTENDLVIELLSNHFDWRQTQKAGAAKGTWSLLAAGAWGCIRGERDKRHDAEYIKAFETIFNSQSASKQQAWLDESIRPGLTNRGLICWGMSEMMSRELKDAITPGLDPFEGSKLRVQQAVSAVECLSSKNASSEWSEILSNRISTLLTSEGTFTVHTPSLNNWKLDLMKKLIDLNLFIPNINTYECLGKRLAEQISAGVQSERERAILGALSLLRLNEKSIEGAYRSPYRRNDTLVELFYKARRSVYEAVEAELIQTPQLAMVFPKQNFPFVGMAKKEEQILPSKDNWEALVKRCKLSSLAAQTTTSVEKSKVRKPLL